MTKILIVVLTIGVCLGVAVAQETPKITKPVPVVGDKKDVPVVPKGQILPVVQKDSLPVVPDTKVGVSSEEGFLPWAFVKNRLDNMLVGTKAYISVEGIKCDSKRKVYLDPDLLYGTQNEDRVVMISKDATGYHLSLDKVSHQWVCQELPAGVKWIPVKSVVVK